jgi:hypothetical protein
VKPDLRVQWQLFLGVAGFIALLAVIYWFVSYEDAGTTMLGLSSGLALLFGGWLYLQDRRPVHRTDTSDDTEGDYLPASSVWPLGVGVGAALTLNGLALGWAYAVPGGLLLALAIAGFVAQSRRRS